MKLWGKVYIDGKIERDVLVEAEFSTDYNDNLKQCFIELCEALDLEKPYWLPNNIKEYNERGKTKFGKENFIEEIKFDNFEIEEIYQ